LRFFDQIKFYEVSPEELSESREHLPKGQTRIRSEETQFSLNEYQAFLEENTSEITEFVDAREHAFDEELARWKRDGQLTYEQADEALIEEDEFVVPENCNVVDSPVSGSVWQCKVKTGDAVQAGDVLMVLESMKMEIEIHAISSGTVHCVLKEQGQSIQSGQSLVLIEET
jgi:urea carboxylase